MIRKWEISTDGGTSWSEVQPRNGGSITFTDQRDLGAGQIFYRRTIGGGILLDDQEYLDLKQLLEDSDARCDGVLIRLMNRCGGEWVEFWRGEFPAAGGTWNLEECTVEVDPKTSDRYDCILENEKEKHNILQAGVVTATAINLPSIQMTICPSVGLTVVGCSGIWDGVNFFDEWSAANAQATPLYQANLLWRERLTTECVGGSPTTPIGSGWVLDEDNCATSGTATFVRATTIPWTFGDAVVGTNTDGVFTPPDDSCDWVFVAAIDERPFDPFDPDLGIVPYYVCLSSGSPTTFSRARTLQSAVEFLIAQTKCGLLGVRSDFFEWNPQGDAPGYAPGVNYVTGLASQVNALVILQKSDVKYPTASSPATIGEMTFAEAMNTLYVMFRVLWEIDDDGYVRIEHWKYWTSAAGLNLTTADNVIEPQIFEYPDGNVPKLERTAFMEAQGRDFVGLDLLYSGPCAGKDSKEWNPGKITTDVSMILSDPTDIANDGFVILATVDTGASYNTIIDNGAITGNLITNAPLSWANLQRDFWTWDRYLPQGTMNGVPTTFDGFLPNILQADVSIALCCNDFDPKDYLTTKLGQRLGIAQAYVDQAEHSLLLDTTTLNLRYSY
jgi:hypothetical protein